MLHSGTLYSEDLTIPLSIALITKTRTFFIFQVNKYVFSLPSLRYNFYYIIYHIINIESVGKIESFHLKLKLYMKADIFPIIKG